ncbi:MAG: 50S ribosomal protein L9 [Chlamydiota bacterium]|nr:50S ribosomal protein L9 [Chlamydiota bacterium]
MKEKQKSRKFLLLEDVKNLGRKGEIARAKPGFVRNHLLPKGKILFLSPHALRIQEQLKQERAAQSVKDEEAARKTANTLKDIPFAVQVKTDPKGILYGSVAASTIVNLIEDQGFDITKKQVLFPQQIKKTGSYTISILLDEGVVAKIKLEVKSDIDIKEEDQQEEIRDPKENNLQKKEESETD